MSSTHISRRTVLRGLGAAVALPLFEAMIPTSALGVAAGPAPKRMAFIMFPLGAWMPYWMPTGDGPDYTMTPCLEPLAEHRKEMIVFGGLTCDKAYANGDGGGDHARAGGAYLTGAPAEENGRRQFPGRCVRRPNCRRPPGRPNTLPFAGIVHRQVPGRRQLRQRLFLRLRTHAVLAQCHDALADRVEPQTSLRPAVRGWTQRPGKRGSQRDPRQRARFRAGRCQGPQSPSWRQRPA